MNITLIEFIDGTAEKGIGIDTIMLVLQLKYLTREEKSKKLVRLFPKGLEECSMPMIMYLEKQHILTRKTKVI